MINTDSPYNTLSFRIDNPPHPDNITLDEICHYCKDDHTTTGIDIDWTSLSCYKKMIVPLFYPGYAIKQWIEAKHRGTMPCRNYSNSMGESQMPAGPNEKELEDFYQASWSASKYRDKRRTD